MSATVVCVVGPTGCGKSELAEELAARRRGIVLEADSMQIYRGMDVGTAKMPLSRRRAEHCGIDLVNPDTPYSAAQYQGYARGVIDAALAAGRLPVVCGGTGLYIRAALDVMDFPAGEQTDNPVRERYSSYLEKHGAQALHELLATRDAAAAKLLHVNNTRRVIRALEMADEGVSYARQAAQFKTRRSYYPTAYVGIERERGELYARIDARVDEMIADGLLSEVEALLAKGLREALCAGQAIGYKELVPVIEDGAPLADAIADIKQASRNYAKRQLTWFRADERVRWLPADGLTTAQLADRASGIIDG